MGWQQSFTDAHDRISSARIVIELSDLDDWTKGSLEELLDAASVDLIKGLNDLADEMAARRQQ